MSERPQSPPLGGRRPARYPMLERTTAFVLVAVLLGVGWMAVVAYQPDVLRLPSESAEVVFTLSGQMDIETMAELKRLIDSEANGRGVVLNLRDLTLVDEDGVIFLERCESNNVKLENCPPYIREWINRQRLGS